MVSSGCYWERKRSFLGTFADIIDNDFIASAVQARTEVRTTDLGFQSDAECGTWTRDQALTTSDVGVRPDGSHSSIEANRIKRRQKIGLQ